MSIAELNALFTAYATARAAGDYAAAIGHLMDIQGRLATTPNLTRSLAGGGSQGIAWNAVNLDSLIGECKRLQAAALAAASGPFQQTKIVYARAR